MRHLDDLPDPTLEDLAELEAEFVTDDDDDPTYDDYMDMVAQAPLGDDESARDRLHRNARDMTRIEHDTTWAFLSKAGSFLGPKEARDKEREQG